MFWVQISTGRKGILFFTWMDELGNRVSLLRDKLPVKHLQLPLARCLLIHSLLLLGQLKWGSLSSQFWSWKFIEFTGNNSFVRWLKKHILCHLVGSHRQKGQWEGFCGLRKLPLSPSLPGWLQQMAKRVWHELWSQQRSTEGTREGSFLLWVEAEASVGAATEGEMLGLALGAAQPSGAAPHGNRPPCLGQNNGGTSYKPTQLGAKTLTLQSWRALSGSGSNTVAAAEF